MTTTTANSINANWLDTLGHALKNNRLIQILAGLLLIQILAAGLIGVLRSGNDNFENAEPLFSFAKDDVTLLEISDNTQSVQLTKQGENWQMGADNSLPVDSSRAATLLASLENLKPGLPVASTTNARDQLEVADDNHQRKLTISAGDSKTSLLLGTSPGIRKSHVRLEGDDKIYSVTLPVSDVPATVDDWLDKSLLAFRDIAKIKSGEIVFEMRGEGDKKNWAMIDGKDESSEFDTEKLSGIVNSLENLSVNGITEKLEPGSDPSTDQGKTEDQANTDSTAPPELESMEILVSTGSADVTLNIQRLGDNATAQRGDIDGIYSISTTLFDDLSSLGNTESWMNENLEQDGTETK